MIPCNEENLFPMMVKKRLIVIQICISKFSKMKKQTKKALYLKPKQLITQISDPKRKRVG